MRSVIDAQDGDPFDVVTVPDTEYSFVPGEQSGYACVLILRAGVIDEALTRRMHDRFGNEPMTAVALRRIAVWLREGSP